MIDLIGESRKIFLRLKLYHILGKSPLVVFEQMNCQIYRTYQNHWVYKIPQEEGTKYYRYVHLIFDDDLLIDYYFSRFNLIKSWL